MLLEPSEEHSAHQIQRCDKCQWYRYDPKERVRVVVDAVKPNEVHSKISSQESQRQEENGHDG